MRKIKQIFKLPSSWFKRFLIFLVVVVFAYSSSLLGLFGTQQASAAQYGRPISDITAAGFTPTPIYTYLDEVTADDITTQVTVANNGGDKSPEVLLSPVTDPESSIGHIIRVRGRTDSGRNSAITTYLYQGATLIATSAAQALSNGVWVTVSYTLTGAEADSITNYSDLRIRVLFNDQGAGGPGNFAYTWAELEVPDAPYYNQYSYRWRSDDGAETAGTSLAAENTAASLSMSLPIRLRFTVTNTGGGVPYSFRLDYTTATNNTCNNSYWSAVPDVATTEPFDMVLTSNYIDQTASTNAATGPGVMSDPSGFSFTAGKLVESTSNSATSVTIGQNQFSELEYAFQVNTNATNNQYCFRVSKAGTALENYAQFPLLNIIYPPNAPVISAPSGTNNSTMPTFQLRATDNERDYLRYVIETCPANSWPCASGGQTYDQTASQTNWSEQNAQSGTAYVSARTIGNSTHAFYSVSTQGVYAFNTTYYVRAKAIDPGGSNTFGPYSSVGSFTTGTLQILITGGTSVSGGTQIGN